MKNKFIAVILLVLVLSLSGCGKEGFIDDRENGLPLEENGEGESLEGGTSEEQESSGEVSITDPEESKGEEGDWPEDFLPQLPRLEGSISISKEEGPKKHFLKFEAIDYEQAAAYAEALKEAGFTKNVNEHSGSNNIKYKAMDEDNNLVIFNWNKSGIAKIELIKKDR